MAKEKDPVERKNYKSNSYEIEAEKSGTLHLEEAPKPHNHGQLVTEDIE
ncbi:hypothetical protein [Mesobacillus campisalis]|nr:hypothetical protein [Mesobacillus campisalis]